MSTNIEQKKLAGIDTMRLVGIDTICDLLGIKRSTAFQWSLTGKLPVHKVGRLNRYRVEEVLRAFGVDDGAFSKSEKK